MTNRPNVEELLATLAKEEMTTAEKKAVWSRVLTRLPSSSGEVIRPTTTMKKTTRYIFRIGAVVALIAILTGTAFASNDAKPGDLLFGIDRALEQVQLSLASDEKAADIRLKHAEERLLEIQAMLAEVRESAEDADVEDMASSADDGNTTDDTASTTEDGDNDEDEDHDDDERDKWSKRISVGAMLVIKDANAIFEGKYDGDTEAAIQAVLDQLSDELGDEAYDKLKIEIKTKQNGDQKLKIEIEMESDDDHEEDDEDDRDKDDDRDRVYRDNDDSEKYSDHDDDHDDDDKYEDDYREEEYNDHDDHDDHDHNYEYQTPTTSAETMGTFTLAEVATHNTPGDCYAAVNGNVYDLSNWVNQHPGGSAAITGLCGTDATSAFGAQHGGQGSPNQVLADLKIGVLE